jgi:rod shape-determining protein MreC
MWSPVEFLTRALSFLERRRNAAVLAGALLGSLWLSTHSDPIAPPLRRAADMVVGPLQTVASGVMAILNVWVWKENQDLKSRLLSERMDRLALDELTLENARLRALLDFPAPAGFRTVPCSVVGLDPDPFGASLTIDRGARAGLSGHEAVVSVDGLVGTVVEVYPSRARVRMITHYEAPVGVRIERNRVLGVVEYDPGSARLMMRNVPATEEVAEGDTLISSGLGGIYPEGLYVGRVETVRLDPMGLVQEIVVIPGAHVPRLEELFILLPLVRQP